MWNDCDIIESTSALTTAQPDIIFVANFAARWHCRLKCSNPMFVFCHVKSPWTRSSLVCLPTTSWRSSTRRCWRQSSSGARYVACIGNFVIQNNLEITLSLLPIIFIMVIIFRLYLNYHPGYDSYDHFKFYIVISVSCRHFPLLIVL